VPQGCVAISTDVSGVPELVVHGKTGLVVSQCAAPPIAEAIERLFGDPALVNRLRAGG
jgi:glycosyltransferase involved in cell wall biosynthesis